MDVKLHLPETTISITTKLETTILIIIIPETTIPITTIPETTIPITIIPETTISVPTSHIIYISTEVVDNASNGTIIYRKKSSSLSTGAICGIIIPCVVALLGIAVASALFKGILSHSQLQLHLPSNITPNFIDTS